MSTRENIRLIARCSLSSWCLVMVERLFLAVPQGCLQFVIVVFPDHTHLLFLIQARISDKNGQIKVSNKLIFVLWKRLFVQSSNYG